jgi:hypothetical protein
MTVVAALVLGSAGTASAAITADASRSAPATSATWSATLHAAAGQASTGTPVSIAWRVTTPRST